MAPKTKKLFYKILERNLTTYDDDSFLNNSIVMRSELFRNYSSI